MRNGIVMKSLPRAAERRISVRQCEVRRKRGVEKGRDALLPLVGTRTSPGRDAVTARFMAQGVALEFDAPIRIAKHFQGGDPNGIERHGPVVPANSVCRPLPPTQGWNDSCVFFLAMTIEELNSLPAHLRVVVLENLQREGTPEAANLLHEATRDSGRCPAITVEELNRMPEHLRSIALENLRRENTEPAKNLVNAARKNHVSNRKEAPPTPKREPTRAERRAIEMRGLPYAERLGAVRKLCLGDESNDIEVLRLMMSDPDATTREEAAWALKMRHHVLEQSAQKAKSHPSDGSLGQTNETPKSDPVLVHAPPVVEFGAPRLSLARLMSNYVSPFEFGRLTGRGVPMPADAAPVYYGHSFSCGCGDAHILNANIPVPREIPGRNKFVTGCPHDESVLNFLKVRGFFRIAGLEAICSTRIHTQEDYDEFCHGVIKAQIG